MVGAAPLEWRSQGAAGSRKHVTCVQAWALLLPWPRAGSSLALSLRFFTNARGRFPAGLPGRAQGTPCF